MSDVRKFSFEISGIFMMAIVDLRLLQGRQWLSKRNFAINFYSHKLSIVISNNISRAFFKLFWQGFD